MKSPTVADALVQSLRAAEVDVVFTLCGNHILPLQESMRRQGMRCVATRSEGAAVFAADAYARIARRPGVAVVTGGPGVSNTSTALLTARGNQSPVVLISGEPSTAVEGQGAQQEADHTGLTSASTKASIRAIRADRVLAQLREAFRIAEHGVSGPVHLTIPADIQQQFAGVAEPDIPPARAALPEPVAPPDFVEAAAQRLRSATRPVLVVGAGVWQRGGEEAAAALAERHGVPTFSLDSARGIPPDAAACGFGSADAGLNTVAESLTAADCVIVAGREIDFRLGYGAFGAKTDWVHVQPDPRSAGRNLPVSALVCAADPAAFLADLETALGEHRVSEAWRHEVAAWRETTPPVAAPGGAGHGEHPGSIADAIARAGNASGAIFALDCGEFVQWCRSRIPAQSPGSWLRLGPQATCGAGLPFGIGAQAAAPDRPVIVIAGDGGLGYHVAELESAIRCGLPVVVVVGRDGAWGVERLLQTGIYGPEAAFTSELRPTDYTAVARGFGCLAVTAGSPDEVEHAIEDAVKDREPRLIQVDIGTQRSRATERMIASLRTATG